MFLDTSIIIEIFQSQKGSNPLSRILDVVATSKEESNYISTIQLAEISDWCAKNKIHPRDGINNVKTIAQVVPLDEGICEESGPIKLSMRESGKKSFGLIDSIILASARSVNQRLLTKDRHFKGEDDCIVLT